MRFILNFIKELFKPAEVHNHKTEHQNRRSQIYIAADLHLDHANIIKYCHRPFKSVHQMNSRLINNWNRTVRKNDTVYFLGDLAFGRGSRNTDYWFSKLNGNIIFIKGNHDRSQRIKFHHHKYLTYKGIKFLLVHSPWDVPKEWGGWVIHGHKHNNNKSFPLVDNKAKRMNVSCELTRYKPIRISELRRLIN